MVGNCVWKSGPKPCQFWLIFQNSVALPFYLFYVQERTKLPSKCHSGRMLSPTKSLPCGINRVPPIILSFLWASTYWQPLPQWLKLFLKAAAESTLQLFQNLQKEPAHHISCHRFQYQPSGGQAAEVGVPAQESLLQAHRQCHYSGSKLLFLRSFTFMEHLL